MRELELIAAIRSGLGDRGGGRVVRASGDDAAVVRARPFAVTSIDTEVEGTHLRRSTHSPRTSASQHPPQRSHRAEEPPLQNDQPQYTQTLRAERDPVAEARVQWRRETRSTPWTPMQPSTSARAAMGTRSEVAAARRRRRASRRSSSTRR